MSIESFEGYPPLQPTEVCTITTPHLAKRAALLFDRVRVITRESEPDTPSDSLIQPTIDDSESVAALTKLYFNLQDAELNTYITVISRLQQGLDRLDVLDPLETFARLFTRHIVSGYAQHGVTVVPLYASDALFSA